MATNQKMYTTINLAIKIWPNTKSNIKSNRNPLIIIKSIIIAVIYSLFFYYLYVHDCISTSEVIKCNFFHLNGIKVK